VVSTFIPITQHDGALVANVAGYRLAVTPTSAMLKLPKGWHLMKLDA